MERVVFDHLLTEDEINSLYKESAEYEHWQRYKWAAYKCKGKKVLDIACGTGYGSELIAINGGEVTGIDISPEAIEFAKGHFTHAKFQLGNAESLDFPDGSFDLVVSFETIEHLDRPELFLSKVRRILKKDGQFIGSVPNEQDTLTWRSHNPFHKNFYSSIEDVELLLSQFNKKTFLSQQNDILDHFDKTKTKYFILEGEKPKDFALIIIPTHNSQNVFPECYKSLLNTGYPFELVAVDNNSRNPGYLNRPGVSKILNRENFKFTRAVNQGIKVSKAPYVLVLNPDCVGNLQKDWLKTMILELEKEKAGIASAILKFPDDTIQHAGAYGFGNHIGYREKDNGQFDKPRECEWVTGACMLFKREVVDKIGEWDEIKYPHYESDREWCKKAKEAGFKIICSTAKLTHLEGKSCETIMDKKEKLRILWHSNSAWTPTGYGVQTHLITEGLQKAGYPIAISSYYGLEGGILNLNGIVCYPKMSMVWGEDSILHHSKDFKADILITLMDIWPLQVDMFCKEVKWINLCPIDHDEVPNPVEVRAKMAFRNVAYSKHGFEAFKRKGISSTYIPHCIDTKIFKPYNKKECRSIFGIPQDAYVVGMVAQNKSGQPSRKSFQQALEAFKIFSQDKPNARIYLHTIMDTMQGGMNITEYCQHLGILDKIIFTLPYNYLLKLGMQEMAQMYSCFDVLLNPSMGEGFGVPILEAQACGLPVVVGNWTSMPELCGAGIKVEASEKLWTPLAAYMYFPKVESIVSALEEIYHGNKEEYKEKALDFTKNYDVDKVIQNYWLPFLEGL